jgi:hypothetical protein
MPPQTMIISDDIYSEQKNVWGRQNYLTRIQIPNNLEMKYRSDNYVYNFSLTFKSHSGL